MYLASIRKSILLVAIAVTLLSTPVLSGQTTPAQSVTIDAAAPSATVCPLLGGNVRLGTRHSDLARFLASRMREVKQITGFQYVRFHAILHDEVGVYDEDESGKPSPQFLLR